MERGCDMKHSGDIKWIIFLQNAKQKYDDRLVLSWMPITDDSLQLEMWNFARKQNISMLTEQIKIFYLHILYIILYNTVHNFFSYLNYHFNSVYKTALHFPSTAVPFASNLINTPKDHLIYWGGLTFNASNFKELSVQIPTESTYLIINLFLLKWINVNITKFAVSFRDVTLYFSARSRLLFRISSPVRIFTRNHSPFHSALLGFRSLIFWVSNSDY